MDKRSYFIKLDLLIVVLGLLLSLGVVANQSSTGEYFRSNSNNAPINTVQRLEFEISQMPGIRKADAEIFGSSAVINIWYDVVVEGNQAVYTSNRVKDLVVVWDSTIAHCKVKPHYGLAVDEFRPY
ncbi:hypothetical protein MFMK1_002253 [Metallumcola ferriviriculae]|uniref:Uncharacterized protein n=1 Tax=Metallumcola ferriviriculae TaxID=3039180 RepID=A0AAU0UQC5_9FIRM|nr:hypothetical protein MFMK1_002253 [Desulfitibacteraceae bacterium MK1]